MLGLSFGHHDAAAALVSEAGIHAAAHEERFSRVKNDPSYPENAIRFCLERERIAPSELSAVAYYEDPLLKLDRIVRRALKHPRDAKAFVVDTLFDWFFLKKLDPRGLIAAKLGIPEDRVVLGNHHASHAAAAYSGGSSSPRFAGDVPFSPVFSPAQRCCSLSTEARYARACEPKRPGSGQGGPRQTSIRCVSASQPAR